LLIVFLLALLLEALFKEPPLKIHPVVITGKIVNTWQIFFPPQQRKSDLFFGTLALLLPLLILAVPAYFFGNLLLAAFFCWSSFSILYFDAEITALLTCCENGNWEMARIKISGLVSRDTANLTNEEIMAAGIETTLENFSDAVTAPIFYFCLGGAAGAIAYRIINTLDAMIGYRGKYEYYGKIPARIDDLVNLIPARISALLIFIGGFLQDLSLKNGWRIYLRDRYQTSSPNAGHTMALGAGLLEVQLTKKECYSLGDNLTPITPQKLRQARNLLRAGNLLVVLISGVILWLLR